MITIDLIRERLSEIRPHGFAQDIVAAGMVHRIDCDDGAVIIALVPGPMPPQSLQATLADIQRGVGALEGVRRVDVRVGSDAEAPRAAAAALPGVSPAAHEPGPLPGVRDILAVASTKGGVGKSTVATNLALAMSRLDRRIGLLDADVYGPSLPMMFGISGRPEVSASKRISPLEKYGIRLMSIGFFLDDSSPVIWRGPLVMGLVRQFLKDVEWGDLDVLVIDLPPGTGDAQLTLLQQVPLAGGVMVTTPQEVATLDVQRGIAMFEQVHTPVFGVIENMSSYTCPHCGREEEVFGAGGGQRIAAHFGVPLLGRIPLVPDIRIGGDAGTPMVIAHPAHPVSAEFTRIAAQVLDAIAAERLASAPPTIIG